MASLIPFRPSDTNYRLAIAFDNVPVFIDTRWNERDQAWYIDFREEDETPIALGIKVVIGTNLGRRSTHKFFVSQIFVPFDTSGVGRDAGFDDLGARVIVQRFTLVDLGFRG